jgi:hypothetical protein
MAYTNREYAVDSCSIDSSCSSCCPICIYLDIVFKASSFIVFSRVYNNLSSTPKEEGEELEKSEDEDELIEDNESPPTG